jgi:HD-GYP domain-containing protein (c-di-GMP phosphodiesterase class II)
MSAEGEYCLVPEERKERAWQAKNARRLLENVRVYMQLISNYDPYTYTHCLEVANYCRKWSPMLGLDEEEQFEVYIAALIHDLGKIYIPRRLLHQEQALNEHDWQVIREHPAAGAKLLIHYEDLDISCKNNISLVITSVMTARVILWG